MHFFLHPAQFRVAIPLFSGQAPSLPSRPSLAASWSPPSISLSFVSPSLSSQGKPVSSRSAFTADLPSISLFRVAISLFSGQASLSPRSPITSCCSPLHTAQFRVAISTCSQGTPLSPSGRPPMLVPPLHLRVAVVLCCHLLQVSRQCVHSLHLARF